MSASPSGQRPRCGPIPARAGEPPTSSTFFRGDGVYPRACGGTDYRGKTVGFGHGLSPRVRGNPSPTVTEADMMGPIPARAGEPCAYCT